MGETSTVIVEELSGYLCPIVLMHKGFFFECTGNNMSVNPSVCQRENRVHCLQDLIMITFQLLKML